VHAVPVLDGMSILPVPHIAHCVFMACSTDTALNLMVLWTINTGVATALSSVVDLIVVGLTFLAVKLPHITDWGVRLIS